MASSASVGPPVGGWNTRDALADMPDTHASVMDNWFPGTDDVRLRRGTVLHATIASGAAVETLMEYVPPDATPCLFAAAGGDIYDVTPSGTAASVHSGLTNNRLEFEQVGTPAGHFLLAVNGADAMLIYDGSTWGAAAITGPDVSRVAWINTHQNRVWFGEKNSLTAWYLDPQSVGGAASQLSLKTYVTGGYIVGQWTWTRDGGDGTDDLCVFITSEGQVVLFAGTDPNSSATWSMIGTFTIGKPVNRRCAVRFGSDLIVVTESGIVPLSGVLGIDRGQTDQVSFSGQINKAFNDAVREAGSDTGRWQVVNYPRGTMVIVNHPKPDDYAYQFVFNTLTGAPCRFTGLPAECWSTLDDRLYYGDANGLVIRADDGPSDQGEPIVGDCLQAFSYFSSPSREKAFKRIEVLIQSAQDPNPTIDVMVDFDLSATLNTLRAPGSGVGVLWDLAVWDTAIWGDAPEKLWRGWESVNGHGRSAAVRLRVNSEFGLPRWLATNWQYVPGGNL